ncbi:MAG: substrate-binding domain-containing protein, partial [Gammaproteobacteria bacterium]
MNNGFKKKKLSKLILAVTGGALIAGSGAVFANGNHDRGKKIGHEYAHRHDKHDRDDVTSYTLQGTCAFLPADRATEFHGNPMTSELNLGMAGNQWVVFDKAMQQFNVWIGTGDGSEPAYRPNDATGWTLADLNQDSTRYFVELIPPGQIRKQIKSGCMLLGNDEERNFLSGNFQVDFDVFASTNYNLMQDLANSGFIDEAVPYIQNKLDLMVAEGNPKGIGADSYGTGDADFDKQFDILMDLLSGDVIASNLDHINEGIHNAANKYMGAAHDYIRDNDQEISMTYTYADGTTETATKMASAWLQDALAVVATPMAGSPAAERLVSRDAGENHSSHDLAAMGCEYSPGEYKFCEFATLNKANTHESRVHHVETPNGIMLVEGYEPVDTGFVWITELAYQINHGNTAVTGMSGSTIGSLGIPTPASDSSVNAPNTYSLALLATSENQDRGRDFINFLRATEGQT